MVSTSTFVNIFDVSIIPNTVPSQEARAPLLVAMISNAARAFVVVFLICTVYLAELYVVLENVCTVNVLPLVIDPVYTALFTFGELPPRVRSL